MRITLGKKLNKIIEEKKVNQDSLEEILGSTKEIEENISRLSKLAAQKKKGTLEIYTEADSSINNAVWQNELKEKFSEDHEVNCFGDNDFRLDATDRKNSYKLLIVAVNGNTFFIALHWAEAAHKTIEMDYVSGDKLIFAVDGILELFRKIEAHNDQE